MTWEETIQKIRQEPEFEDLVRLAYFDKDLALNVTRFGGSEEYKETLAIFKHHAPNAKTILDIGSGNGISSINFALQDYTVTSVEPDPSSTVGAGAILWLKEHYQLDNLKVFTAFAEDLQFAEASFDIVYIRQAMHHAADLPTFMKECVRVLKPGGLLLTVRDHVVFDAADKKWFLESHPLQKYYGGENAYTSQEYRNAIKEAGANIIKELRYYESSINYFPATRDDIKGMLHDRDVRLRKHLKGKIGVISDFPFIFYLYKKIKRIDTTRALDETKVPGRMYSYIARKQ